MFALGISLHSVILCPINHAFDTDTLLIGRDTRYIMFLFNDFMIIEQCQMRHHSCIMFLQATFKFTTV